MHREDDEMSGDHLVVVHRPDDSESENGILGIFPRVLLQFLNQFHDFIVHLSRFFSREPGRTVGMFPLRQECPATRAFVVRNIRLVCCASGHTVGCVACRNSYTVVDDHGVHS